MADHAATGNEFTVLLDRRTGGVDESGEGPMGATPTACGGGDGRGESAGGRGGRGSARTPGDNDDDSDTRGSLGEPPDELPPRAPSRGAGAGGAGGGGFVRRSSMVPGAAGGGGGGTLGRGPSEVRGAPCVRMVRVAVELP